MLVATLRPNQAMELVSSLEIPEGKLQLPYAVEATGIICFV